MTTKPKKPKPVRIYVDDCYACEDLLDARHYTPDSWELAFDYSCKNKAFPKPKLIAGYVGWNENIGGVPTWCPRRKKP